MKCINPRKLKNPARTGLDDYYIVTSCGKCFACLSNRRRSWLFRLKNEEMCSNFSVFVTFTYDDVHCDGYLHKRDLQNFIKRLRHYYKFTYYVIGEYGTTTYRPHYHAVFFFKDDLVLIQDLNILFSKLWHFGFFSIKKCSYRRLNYVLHYHTRPKVVNGKPTFQLYSKGMGIEFLNQPGLIQYLVDNKSALIKSLDGGTYVIPRYYRKKLSELYDIDLAFEVNTAKSSTDVMLEKSFDSPLYRISEEQQVNFLHSLSDVSKSKIKKYNNQDKFI